MDKIDQIYLDRIKHPCKVMYWCWKDETWKEFNECGCCLNLDNWGHCDYQEGLKVVQL